MDADSPDTAYSFPTSDTYADSEVRIREPTRISCRVRVWREAQYKPHYERADRAYAAHQPETVVHGAYANREGDHLRTANNGSRR